MNNCNQCFCNIIRSASYTVGATFGIVTGFTDADVENGKKYRLILCTNLPSMTTIVPVTLQINGTQYPVLDKIGNNLMSDQLHTRKCYNLVIGTNPVHFMVLDCIPKSAFYPVEEAPEEVSVIEKLNK